MRSNPQKSWILKKKRKLKYVGKWHIKFSEEETSILRMDDVKKLLQLK